MSVRESVAVAAAIHTVLPRMTRRHRRDASASSIDSGRDPAKQTTDAARGAVCRTTRSVALTADRRPIVDLRERLTAAFEASLLLSAARQNDIVKKLGSWAAILAVPTAIADIYGMNFKNMTELDWSFRLSRVIVVDADDLQYPVFLLP
jgi:magnesium transporter